MERAKFNDFLSPSSDISDSGSIHLKLIDLEVECSSQSEGQNSGFSSSQIPKIAGKIILQDKENQNMKPQMLNKNSQICKSKIIDLSPKSQQEQKLIYQQNGADNQELQKGTQNYVPQNFELLCLKESNNLSRKPSEDDKSNDQVSARSGKESDKAFSFMSQSYKGSDMDLSDKEFQVPLSYNPFVEEYKTFDFEPAQALIRHQSQENDNTASFQDLFVAPVQQRQPSESSNEPQAIQNASDDQSQQRKCSLGSEYELCSNNSDFDFPVEPEYPDIQWFNKNAKDFVASRGLTKLIRSSQEDAQPKK